MLSPPGAKYHDGSRAVALAPLMEACGEGMPCACEYAARDA